MIILYIRKVILLFILYLILYVTNASEDKSANQVCSVLLDSFYNNAMETDEQAFDPALLEFKATFSIEQPIRRNEFGTIKELLMKHCFPDTLTIEEKELRFNILLSHRHLYVLFKQNAVSLHNMTEQCLRTRERQQGETKIAKAILTYDKNKSYTKPLKLILIPKKQPTSFHIFKISLKAQATNCGFKFYWSNNTLIQDKPFAEITRDCQTPIFFPLDEIDNCLFTEEKSMQQFDNNLLDGRNVQTDNKNGVKMNLALENDNLISNIDIYEKRFQGIIISMGKQYGFIKCGYGEPNVFFHYNKSGYESIYINDFFFVSAFVNFRKQIVNGKPIAVALDVFKIGDGREVIRF